MRLLLAAFGWGFVTIGVVGIFVPLLPTTPFLIVAAAIFSRSSPRFEGWLLAHPRFGEPLQTWRHQGAIRRRHKFVACVSMACSFAILLVFFTLPAVAIIVAGVLMATAAVYVASRPEPGH
ncbi:YbaN family protein (plasmid) [Rhizobium sullae]|uniref:YbaN family protein n=1 Tax=Rhizobium sullae TaxID=50338 RepID=A0ABY5XVV6_RHISU|nr:YbaN family protein [Rhizobium sullae]UWU18752.1 YbaN family protein [Rhizobium sullae]